MLVQKNERIFGTETYGSKIQILADLKPFFVP